jgi:arylsulfatase A-like enzyme
MSEKRPNILYIMADDHAAHAMTCYGSVINHTPNLDRIAEEGMRFDNCFCTNSICSPSRAVILTGLHSHRNGVLTLGDKFDGRQQTFPKLLQQAGYQTAMIGKWHLGHGGVHDPTGFDYWNVLPGQGAYHDPAFIEMGVRGKVEGYVTDLITDSCLDWLDQRDPDKPFLLLCHHKAPHDKWEYDDKHAGMFKGQTVPFPPTFNDDYGNRAKAAADSTQRIENIDRHLNNLDDPIPTDLEGQALKEWKYQKYIKDYLRVVASIDDNVGRMLDYLDREGLADDTIVVYTSDQGFFLGDHGWYDKRFFYEESLRMPFVVRYPREIEPGGVASKMAVNLDFAPTFLDFAGVEAPEPMQGRSLRPLMRGDLPRDWPASMYYRYWMHRAHFNVYAHYGVRTERYKLIYYYGEALECTGAIDKPSTPEWELFDLQEDPMELNNVYEDDAYRDVVSELEAELKRLREEAGDESAPWTK